MPHNTADHSEDVMSPDQVSADRIFSLFHDAYFDVQRDEAGDVYLQDTYRVWIFPQEGGEQLRLMAQFNGNAEVARETKVEFANRVNYEYKLLRAYVDDDNDIGFDYYIPVEGGITKRNIVLSVRRFVEYVRVALGSDTQNVFA